MNKTSADNSRFFDYLKDLKELKTDSQLALALGVQAPSLSKMRHNRLPIGDGLIIHIHQEFGLSIRDIKAKLNLPSLRSFNET